MSIIKITKEQEDFIEELLYDTGFEIWNASCTLRLNCDNLLDLPFDEEIKRINNVFNKFDILYEQEGKETAWLKTSKGIDENFVDVVAKIIEPRFANRERFFED